MGQARVIPSRPATMAGMAAVATVREIDTPSGPARAHLSRGGSRGLVVLGHGAGGGVEASDLLAVTAALRGDGWTVARVEQPYRVRGSRAPEPAPRLDAAWSAVLRSLRARRSGPVVVGGRSSGARVACRTASGVGADAMVALAFPLHPPGKPERSRADELSVVSVPALVVQGERDPFGAAAQLRAATEGQMSGLTVVEVPGDHSLRQASAVVGPVVAEWLAGIGL